MGSRVGRPLHGADRLFGARHRWAVSLAGLAFSVVVSTAAHAFTPTPQEACCQAVVQGLAEAPHCGPERPSVETCTQVLAGMARAVEAQARARAERALERPAERAPSRPPSGVGRGLVFGVVGLLSIAALRRVGLRRALRPLVGLGVFVATVGGVAWGLTTLACLPLRCVDTMGLGVLLVSLLPATAIAAWVTRRVLRFHGPRAGDDGVADP